MGLVIKSQFIWLKWVYICLYMYKIQIHRVMGDAADYILGTFTAWCAGSNRRGMESWSLKSASIQKETTHIIPPIHLKLFTAIDFSELVLYHVSQTHKGSWILSFAFRKCWNHEPLIFHPGECRLVNIIVSSKNCVASERVRRVRRYQVY